eukprot:m.175674 g.175674  ORF g.175674 m.175674 type:complete len:2346 (-) comp21363_c0_seq2:105-7142(-)
MAELHVTVVEASGLKDVEKGGLLKKKKTDVSDPFVVLELEGQTFKTEVKENDLNPKWNQTFTFKLSKPLSGSTPPLNVTLYDHQRVGKQEMLGKCEVKLAFLRGTTTDTAFHKLKNEDGSNGDGRIKLQLTYNDPNKGAGAVEGGDGAAAAAPGAADGAVDPNDPNAAADREAKMEQRAKNRSLRRSNISYSSKPCDFQLRVKIHEGRSLQSADSLNPVCKISCSGQRRQTRVHRSTINPLFKESFVFNFHQPPSKLMDEELALEVFNSRRIRRDALVGQFRLEVGLAYEQPLHTLARKWVMLSNASDPSAGVMGYLKVTITVLGPGDESPPEDSVADDADEDVEENLLRPPGMEPEPVDLVVKVFSGEDFPQTDPSFKTGIKALDKLTRQENKDDCDPYFKIFFAGKKATTSVKDNTYNPRWLQELHLPLMLPSMCDKMKIQVMDSDAGIILNEDDLIGTHLLPVRHVSSNNPDGSGFLPTFGPAYINIYGSVREFGVFMSDHAERINKGILEGCAFRGRVFVEIQSQAQADDKAVTKNVELGESEEKRVQPYQSRKAYKLRVELLDLNRLSDAVRKGPIRIEASVGLFGNTTDANGICNSTTSITSPITAVFDGQCNYYVAWENKKPCLELDCEWEDVDFRIVALNKLKNTIKYIAKAADIVEEFTNLDLQISTPQKAREALVGTVDNLVHFIKLCHQRAAELPAAGFTRLDNYLRDMREKEKEEAADDANNLLRRLLEVGETPLIAATRNDHVEVVKMLLEYGADPSKRDPTGRTAAQWAQLLDLGEMDRVIRETQRDPALTPEFLLSQLPPGVQLTDASRLSASEHLLKFARLGAIEEVERALKWQANPDFVVEVAGSTVNPIREPSLLDELKDLRMRLEEVAHDPQISIPDVILWLFTKDSRKAYLRVPVQDIFYSGDGDVLDHGAGDYFGVVRNSFMKLPQASPKDVTKTGDVPAQIQFRCWFGPADTQPNWPQPLGEFISLAETYENQRYLPIKGWGNHMLPTDRNHWSDRSGKHTQPKDAVELPNPAWMWRGDWYLDPEHQEADAEASLDKLTEEVFENQRYYPIRGWSAKLLPTDRPSFSSLDGSEQRTKEEVDEELPEGWRWESDEWQVDEARAVDANGWEYSFEFNGDYYPAKKRTHFVRRRRWIRTRIRVEEYKFVPASAKPSTADGEEAIEDGWEYAGDFGKPFHKRKKKSDGVRRRRWHRESMPQPDQMETALIPLPKDDPLQAQLYTVGHFFLYESCHTYQFRAHIYQARDLPAEDSSGQSDPYVNVIFGHRSAKTWIVKQNSNPMFNQTIIIDGVILPGSREQNTDILPIAVCEVFDYDAIGSDDFLGRTKARPVLRSEDNPAPPVLEWHTLTRGLDTTGELLICFEIMPSSYAPKCPLPKEITIKEEATKTKKTITPLPKDIRPETELARVDVLAWGLRKLTKYKLLTVNNPSVEVECGGVSVATPKLANFKINPNFAGEPASKKEREALEKAGQQGTSADAADAAASTVSQQKGQELHTSGGFKELAEFLSAELAFRHCILSFELWLPCKEKYVPPLNIRVLDHRKFGRTPVVGVHTISSLTPYKREVPRPNATWRPDIAEKVRIRDAKLAENARKRAERGQLLPRVTPEKPKIKRHFGQNHVAVTIHNRAEANAGCWQRRKKQLAQLKANFAFPKFWKKSFGDVQPEELEFVDETIDWWTKYFNSRGIIVEGQPEYEGDLMEVYHHELEREFDVADALKTFEVFRGKDDEKKLSGLFKGDLVIYTPYALDGPDVGEVWKYLPPARTMKTLVRVYIIRAMELVPQDLNGRCDAYIQIHLGKRRIVRDRDNYVPSNLNPMIARVYEFEAVVPFDSELRISVWDYDSISSDDMVGETVVDLEDRLLSSYRATCGLAKSYITEGPNKWRDMHKPRELLAQRCVHYELPPPQYSAVGYEPQVSVALFPGKSARTFPEKTPLREAEGECEECMLNTDLICTSCFRAFFCSDECREKMADLHAPECKRNRELDLENAALAALHAAGLVPEHIETRRLYNPIQPGIEQGKLEMWIDLFPKPEEEERALALIPPPIAVSRRQPKQYQLRCVVYNCKDVIMMDRSFTGQRMTDIYVKAFMKGRENKRMKTDVHYRSLNGEGMFNWRLLFDFDYLPAEDALVVKKKTSFFSRAKNAEEIKLPPVLTIQIWDNDLFSPDDYVGSIDVKLSDMLVPVKDAKDCDFQREVTDEDFLNLFKARRVKGWYPVTRGAKEKEEQTGKVEVEIELMTMEEAMAKPAGKGRSDPNQWPTLTKPKRPATSFFWLTSPWKSFRYIIWRAYKWWIIGILTLLIVLFFIGLILYNTPFFMVKKAFGDIQN